MSKNVLHSVKKAPAPPAQVQHAHPAANTAKVSPAPHNKDGVTPKDKHAFNQPRVQVTNMTESDFRWSITPTRSTHSSLTSGRSEIDAIAAVRKNRTILPDVAAYEDAPEIAHLKLMRSKEISSAGSGQDMNLNENQRLPLVNKFSPFESFSTCCNDCVGFLRKCFGFAPHYDELDDLEPVTARTRHSLEFIRRLTRGDSSRRTASDTSSVTSTVSNISPVDNKNNKKLKGQAYSSILEGLTQLHEVHHRYKQLILLLTFTRYAEDPLDDVELELSHSRTVLGSYIWLATYILEQDQYDNDVIYSGYPAADVEEVVKSLERIVGLSVFTWKACVKTIENVEQIHEHVAHVFSALMSKFAKEEDKEIKKTRHIRVHSNYQRRAEELDKMKAEYDTRNVAGGHSAWAKFSLAPLRILYKDGKKAATESWRGFELLSQDKKFGLLKMLINDASKIWSAVLEQLQLIAKMLKTSGVDGGGLQPPKNPKGGGIENILSFEDGVMHMQNYLEQLGTTKWNKEDIRDFLEVEKIVIDNLDLLTLGTATIRGLLHDGRHIVHICYEMTREMDYMECRQLSVYEDIVTRSLVELDAEEQRKGGSGRKQNQRESTGSSPSADVVGRTSHRKKKKSLFDIEERTLEQKEVEIQFDRSIYQDIIKELPVFTNHLSVGLTLQEAEAVFSESSHAMLNSPVVHV